MTFFVSVVIAPHHPARSIVRALIQNRVELNQEIKDKKGKKRIMRNTPAVTSVDECTNAETGVGAAIASGSHALNGS